MLIRHPRAGTQSTETVIRSGGQSAIRLQEAAPMRRRLFMLLSVLALSGVVATAAVAQGRTHATRHGGALKAHHRKSPRTDPSKTPLPVDQMNSAMQLQGTFGNGVLSYSFDRTDINNVTLNGVPIDPSFEINGSMDFQPLGDGRAFLNGDLPVTTSDIDTTISTIIGSGLVFQAEHQHFYDFSPMVWFIHIRGRGNAVELAKKVHAV